MNEKQIPLKNRKQIQPQSPESTNEALGFVESSLEEAEVPLKIIMKMSIVVDEIYSNIVRYSGAQTSEIACGVVDGTIILVFKDNGQPYNPLEAKEPDITLSAEDRQIGGLGIFMVKKTMDEVLYSYEEDSNILTLKKAL